MKDNRALPAPFLIVIQLAQMSDDPLPRPGSGANALDEGVIGMGLALFGPLIASQKHPCLLGASMAKEARENQPGRFPLQRQKQVSTTENSDDLQETGLKIVWFLCQVRNIG